MLDGPTREAAASSGCDSDGSSAGVTRVEGRPRGRRLEVGMRVCIAILSLCAATVFLQPGRSVLATPSSPAQVSAEAEGLVGTWRLVRLETLRQDGQVIYPFYGRHPEGLLIYDRSGWMSVQIVSDPKPTTPRASSRESFLAAPAADILCA